MSRAAVLASACLITVGVLGMGARPLPAGDATLLEHMEGLKENLKGVAMGLQAEDTERTLEHVAEMQRLVLLAKLGVPSNLEEQPEDVREAHRAGFRKDMARLLGELAGMEVEILDGERGKAFERVRGALFRMREEAHERYQASR